MKFARAILQPNNSLHFLDIEDDSPIANEIVYAALSSGRARFVNDDFFEPEPNTDDDFAQAPENVGLIAFKPISSNHVN